MLNNFLLFASMHLLTVPLPLYVKQIGGGPSQVGLVMGTFAVAAILARPYVGRLVDKLGGKPSLLLGSLILAIGPLLYIASRSVSALLVARFLHGFGISASSTAYIIIIAALAPPGQGFVRLFVLSASVAALSLLTAFFVIEPQSTGRNDDSDEEGEGAFFQVLGLRSVWVPSGAMGVLGVTYGSILTFLPLFAIQQDIDNPGFFFTVYGLTLIAAQVLAGRASDLVGRMRVIVPAMVLLALPFFVLALVQSLPLLLGMAVLYGLGFGSARATLNTLMVDTVPTSTRGVAMSIAYGSFDLGIGLGSYLLGWVAQIQGYQAMYGAVGIVCLLGVVVFALLARG